MKLQATKGGPKVANPDGLIKAAGLSEDKSDVEGKSVHGDPANITKP